MAVLRPKRYRGRWFERDHAVVLHRFDPKRVYRIVLDDTERAPLRLFRPSRQSRRQLTLKRMTRTSPSWTG